MRCLPQLRLGKAHDPILRDTSHVSSLGRPWLSVARFQFAAKDASDLDREASDNGELNGCKKNRSAGKKGKGPRAAPGACEFASSASQEGASIASASLPRHDVLTSQGGRKAHPVLAARLPQPALAACPDTVSAETCQNSQPGPGPPGPMEQGGGARSRNCHCSRTAKCQH